MFHFLLSPFNSHYTEVSFHFVTPWILTLFLRYIWNPMFHLWKWIKLFLEHRVTPWECTIFCLLVSVGKCCGYSPEWCYLSLCIIRFYVFCPHSRLDESNQDQHLNCVSDSSKKLVKCHRGNNSFEEEDLYVRVNVTINGYWYIVCQCYEITVIGKNFHVKWVHITTHH